MELLPLDFVLCNFQLDLSLMTIAKRQSKAMGDLGKNQVNTKISGLEQRKYAMKLKIFLKCSQKSFVILIA